MTRAILSHTLIVLTIAVLGACSSGGSDSGTAGPGSLSVRLMDAPVEGVTEVVIEIAGLRIKPEDGPAMDLTLPQPTITVNLLELNESNAAILIDNEVVPAGSYNWLEIDVNASFDSVMDSYVMTDVGGQEEVRVPSGRVRLVNGFDVGANQSTRFLLDWDVRKGLVNPPGQPGYLLKPAIRVLGVDEYGLLSGTVDALVLDDASCLNDDAIDVAVGNVVYVYEGLDITPFDIDGIDPEPAATANVAQNQAGDYVYAVALMPGDYTVAFSCEAGNDLPESTENLVFLQPTNVTMDGDGEIVDFSPAPM